MANQFGVVLLALAACTGSKGDKGDPGDPGGTSAAIAAVTPTAGLLARELDVAIAGNDTAFDATTTVTFGAGISVASTTLVSSAAIVAHVVIDPAATVGPRDVAVTTGGVALTATSGFAVQPAIDVYVMDGNQQQGGIALVTLQDRDATLFDTGFYQPVDGFVAEVMVEPRLFAVGGDATMISVSNVDAQDATGYVVFDPLAPAHATITAANLDPADGRTPVITFDNDPALLPLEARTATLLTTTTSASIAAPYASVVYKVTTSGAAIVSISSTPSPGLATEPSACFYGAGGTSADLLTAFLANGLFPVAAPTSLYAVVFGAGFEGGPGYSVDTTPQITPATLNTETAAAHATLGTAQVIAPANFSGPLVIAGALSTPNETDVYALGNSAGVGITTVTVTGPAGLSAFITDSSQYLSAVVGNTGHNALSETGLGAGTYYLIVTADSPSTMAPYTIGIEVETP